VLLATTTVLAEFQVGQVLWSLLWFFIFVLWIWLVISIFVDITRSDDLSGVAKALWALFVIVTPFLGVFVYLIVRGARMGDRQIRTMRAREKAHQQPPAAASRRNEELATLAELHTSGAITDDEYTRAKARTLG
jgi:type VI protein secretion system component VasK